MLKKTKYFPSQKESEEVFLLLRRHWFIYVPIILIGFFMILPLPLGYYWLINYEGTIQPIILLSLIVISGSYLLFTLGLLLYGFIDYYLDVDVVTNQRIVDIAQNGFFKRQISELSLDQVEDVSANVKGIFPTFLHYGDVHIQTAGAKANFIFESVPHPYRISKIIADLHDQAIGDVPDKQLSKKVTEEAHAHQEVTLSNKEEVEPVTPHLSQQKQEKILAGIAQTEKEIGITPAEGEMKEGKEIDF